MQEEADVYKRQAVCFHAIVMYTPTTLPSTCWISANIRYAGNFLLSVSVFHGIKFLEHFSYVKNKLYSQKEIIITCMLSHIPAKHFAIQLGVKKGDTNVFQKRSTSRSHIWSHHAQRHRNDINDVEHFTMDVAVKQFFGNYIYKKTVLSQLFQ